MLSINLEFIKSNFKSYQVIIMMLLSLSIYGCSSAPHQEMSDARQIISSVSLDIEESKLGNKLSIATIMNKAKNQLAIAKKLLNESKYADARTHAVNAAKLAKLAKTEIQHQIK